ncbi:endolytic transglycosylase MltG [Treponema phagedenis]|uniref:endolytic transglycosylase MltG n=1 Tax=Treponema phagedenis TaxID=162 RepID=UPI0011EF3C2E|nr:endolytic transglycosylase MltG [Treponema phagedenis]TYT78262.1 endolytic transglycosylase MltG [Treponema phagedenis]
MGKKKKYIYLWSAFAGVLFIIVIVLAAFLADSPVITTNADKDEIIFSIEKGAGASTVVHNLKTEGLIRSELFAKIYIKLRKLTLKAGNYRLSANLSTKTILHILDSMQNQALMRITIPEGLTLRKTAELFEKAQIIPAAAFIAAAENAQMLASFGITAKTVEGFLYPDTYMFALDETAEAIVNLMLKTFFAKVRTIPNFPKESEKIFETVILASIIEREYRLASEAPKIAGVFVNRLKIGMGLQSCATIEYIITEIHGKPHPDRLFNRDLEIDSPFNTYKWRGLPPAPIANPGLTALSAAANPETHNFFYFRLEDVKTGSHVFTKTLNEHDRAGALILKKAAGK